MALKRLGARVLLYFRQQHENVADPWQFSTTLLNGAYFLGEGGHAQVLARMGPRRLFCSAKYSEARPPPPPPPAAQDSAAELNAEKSQKNTSSSDSGGSSSSGTNPVGTWALSKLKQIRMELKQVPPLARTLGLAGAIPFVALSPPLGYILPLPELLTDAYVVEAQTEYGAVILSFLGGPHWGIAMVDKAYQGTITTSSVRYLWSVTPCLLAWFALLLPTVPKLEVLLLSFGSAVLVDFFMVKAKLLPAWYLPLRILLTTIAMLSMGSSLVVEATKETLEAATAASPR